MPPTPHTHINLYLVSSSFITQSELCRWASPQHRAPPKFNVQLPFVVLLLAPAGREINHVPADHRGAPHHNGGSSLGGCDHLAGDETRATPDITLPLLPVSGPGGAYIRPTTRRTAGHPALPRRPRGEQQPPGGCLLLERQVQHQLR